MKFILIITILFGLALGISAQNNCINEVSTDPNDPYNSMLPTTQIQGSSTAIPDDPRFINRYDWTATSNLQLQNMQINQEMLYLHNASAPYYNYISDGEPMTPENGWELMLYNVGTYPDLSDNPNGEAADIPYIALYNRFTGILRVFATYGDGYLPSGISFDGVLISVEFASANIVNGALRLRDGGDKALDNQTSALNTLATALHLNSPSKWFSADFQLTYDPCVCYYPSKLRLRFDFLERMELNLYGRSITVPDNIADGNNLLTNNFLTNFQFSSTDPYNQIIMYEVMEDFVDDYIAKMQTYKNDLAAVQEYNKEVETNLFIANLFKAVVINGATFAVSSFVTQQWYNELTQYENGDKFIPPSGSDSTTVKKYTEKLKSFASKAFGQTVESFIKKNFEKKPLPNKPDAPMASFTEMKMTGVIENSTTIYGSRFFTPGSYGSEGTGTPTIVNPLEYPIYNNAVGTFALLNSPKIKAYKSLGELYHEHNEGYSYYTAWNRNYQFKLDNDLYYALNNIDVLSHEVSVSFQIKGDVEQLNTDISNIDSYLDYVNSINVSSLGVNTDIFYPLQVTSGYGFNGGANYCFPLSQSCTSEEYYLPNTSYDKDSLTLFTEYFPLDAISPVIFSVGIMNQYFTIQYPINENEIDPTVHGRSLENIELEMRVIVDVIYNQLDENGERNTGSYMFMYDVDDIDWVTTPLSTDLANSLVNYSTFEEHLTLDDTEFDGSPVDGCKLVGTHYTCHGWEDVTIDGDLTTSGGHTVDIFGGDNVFVVGESNVSPEIVLDIRTLLDYSDPMPRADGEFVRNFCMKEPGFPSYSANLPNKAALAEYEALEAAREKTPKQPLLELSLFPVPAQNILNIRSSIELSGETFVLMDLTGRKLECSIKKMGGTMYELDVSKLADGAYYLSTFSNEGESKRMFNVLRIN